MCRYSESKVPGDLRVHVEYNTKMRDPDSPFRWLTIARLLDRETGEERASGVSACGPRDNPNRKVGRAIAVGRALKHYFERHHEVPGAVR